MSTEVRSNVFGDGRAENDRAMLARSFYEWQDYRTLRDSDDRFVVVGRRGTGKSALTYRLAGDWAAQKTITLVVAPTEEAVIGLRSVAGLFGDKVSRIRAGVKLAWRYAVLLELAARIEQNYKSRADLNATETTAAHLRRWKQFGDTPTERIRNCLREKLVSASAPEERIADLPKALNLNRITEEVATLLKKSGQKYAVLFDRLDEGYEPDSVGVGIVDGIIYGLDEIKNHLSESVRVLVFLRDNIFRAIEEADNDFSRNIEGQVLRLHWDPIELFHLMNLRIRAAFGFEQESDVKTWNRYVHDELHGVDGFKRCLKLTLYRPRDLLALMNFSHLHARKQDRQTLMPADLDAAALQISSIRYEDLIKEYSSVFPDIRHFTQVFAGAAPLLTVQEARTRIAHLESAGALSQPGLQHQRIVGGPDGVVRALYGVGFFGIVEEGTGRFVFSHDGKRPNVRYSEESKLLIHPCYGVALNLVGQADAAPSSEDIFDEYEISISSESKELRERKLGQMISALAAIPPGDEGAGQFEEWCERTVEIAFAQNLTNIALHPNKAAAQRRDIVATNQGLSGFWKRLLQDYDTRQVVFEVKNYEKLSVDEYRQTSGYLGREYGKCAFIICRDPVSELSGADLGGFREFYYQHNHVIIKLTARRLCSLLSKLRSPQRNDDVDRLMDKHLDAHIRLYATGQTDAVKGHSRARKRKK